MAKKAASREKRRNSPKTGKHRRPRSNRKPNLQLTDYLLESHPELDC
jgi:hypothetical protein